MVNSDLQENMNLQENMDWPHFKVNGSCVFFLLTKKHNNLPTILHLFRYLEGGSFK